jgi:predicted dehydrogenase/glycerophosphoryl diester phosphodiesterase/phosphorylcholine metabolism protein LicD|uniref:glycerophosphodiester phosphodiesterase family protein n=1 Tax=Lachnospira eligens TaxID=39485 RepID=UPI003FED6E3E
MFFNDEYYKEQNRDGFIVSQDMKRVWAAQLEVLQEVKRVCNILNIHFFADWGTLLGAVRHKGFIPWDDDMDIAMLRKDYMRFLSEAPALLEKYYEIKSVYNDPTDDTIKARIINGRHINFEPDFLSKFHGCPYVVGIDIFPVDNITEDKDRLDKQISGLRFLLKMVQSIPEEAPYSDDVLELMRKVENTFGIPIDYNNRLRHELKKIYDIVCAIYQNEKTEEVCSMIDFAEGWDYHAKREWYEDICELPFENTTIPVPAGYDGLLRIKYGKDYMTPRNVGSSHNYPFYKSQIEELRLVMEHEFNRGFTTNEVVELIHEKTRAAVINIGIIGTGRIAARFLEESSYVSGINVSSIYNPHLESALWFAKNNKIDIDGPMILTDDIEVFFDSVDAVYIATPHETHTEYISMALRRGKHVLCEKPMGLNKSDIKEMLAIANDNNLVCMEAIKTAYCAGFQQILDIVKSGAIGKVRDVEAAFSKIGAAAGREMWGRSGGSFTELASYCLLPVMKLLGTDVKDIHTYSVESPLGTDSYTKMMITYEDGVATIKTGLGVKTEGELIVAGDDGYIRVPSPWWLTKRIEVHHENPNQIEVYEEEFAGGGLRYEIEAFVKCINNPGNVKKITDEESIWLSDMMEQFLAKRKVDVHSADTESLRNVNIWAHRGSSMMNPENTLLAFRKAAELEGITGIEFDVQLTKDGEIVVIHDEKVDRTTDGTGNVRDYTLNELKQLTISGDGEVHSIPTLRETFEMLAPYCKNKGLRLNIELKNSIIRYEGMEQKVIDMVSEFNLEDYVVYSSFNHDSIGLVKQIKADAEVAYLAGDYHRCMDGIRKYGGMTIHPAQWGMPVNKGDVEDIRNAGFCVRMWNGSEPLYGQCRTLPDTDLREYYRLGATDIFTNVPERYCVNRR